MDKIEAGILAAEAATAPLYGGGRLGGVAQSIGDWDTALSNGWYMGAGAANQPVADGGWYIGIVTVHNAAWVTQEAWAFTTGNDKLPTRYLRRQNNGVWGPWLPVTDVNGKMLNVASLNGDGRIDWGVGGTNDTNLYRSGAGVLKTDGALSANGDVLAHAGGEGQVRLMDYGFGGAGITFGAAQDTNLYRVVAGQVRTDGALGVGKEIYVDALGGGNKIYFGSAADTNLYRSAAGKLRTDGTLDANALTVNGVPVGGGGVDYIGNWGAGTTYKAGDVVRHNGIDYLAVNPSTGQTPPAALGLGAGFGTTLPASPVDGQEYTLVDSLTAPTYSWRFRYTASITGANKWIFVGGAPYISAGGSGTIASAAYADFPSGNPSVVVARAGVYAFRLGVACYGTAASGSNNLFASIKVGAAATADANACRVENFSQSVPISLARSGTVVAAAGDTLKLQGRAASGSLISYYAFLEITPVAVA